MIMRFRIGELLLALFLFGSCTPKSHYAGEVKEIADSKAVVELEGQLLKVECPGAMTISAYDTLLLVSTDHRPSAALDIFSLNSGKLLGTFCTKGKGPNEFISFHHYGQYMVDSAGSVLLPAIDYARKFAVIDLTQSLAQGRTCFARVLPWADPYFRTSGLFPLGGDSMLIQYPCYKTDARDFDYHLPRTILSIDGREARAYEVFARKVETPQFSQLSSFVFDAISSLKPDGTKWVEGLRGADYLNVVDIESGRVTGAKTKDTPSLEQIGSDSFEQIRFYYMSVAATDDLIFALYIDQPVERFQTEPLPGEIRVFDWEANLLMRIKVRENLSWITISEKTGMLYGLDKDEHIYQYDLKTTLESAQKPH